MNIIRKEFNLNMDVEALESLLLSDTNDIKNLLNSNKNEIFELIPELKYEDGFDQKHPHHDLDVWNHTLKALENVDSKDLDVRMSLLLHDIGKPFSYQEEGSIRHFHGHPEKSYEMAKPILTRLGYDKDFTTNVLYLIRTHDTIIDPNNLDNSMDMIQKRLKIQYADAKAHSIKTVPKRIKFLDEISKQVKAKALEVDLSL